MWRMTENEKEERSSLWRESEQYAVDYLLQQGYTIRERNWKPRHTQLEVDIIAEKDNVIVFVEVKARKSTDSSPADAVNAEKMRFIIRAARIYLSMEPREDLEYRLDIITVKGTPGNFILDHIPDAFMPF